MRLKPYAALLAFSLVSAAAHSESAADENSALRAEIAALKARNEMLERSCPAAATTPLGSASSTASSSAASISIPIIATATDTGNAAISLSSAEVAATQKLYSHTGCDQGLFSGPPPGKWRDAKAWSRINKGMTAFDVENNLGVEHYDIKKGANIQWQYGRCGNSWEASVTLVDGLVVSISPPGDD